MVWAGGGMRKVGMVVLVDGHGNRRTLSRPPTDRLQQSPNMWWGEWHEWVQACSYKLAQELAVTGGRRWLGGAQRMQFGRQVVRSVPVYLGRLTGVSEPNLENTGLVAH